jgi:hypothetical protein
LIYFDEDFIEIRGHLTQSAYEKGRIIQDNFGKTEMGRDLLSQDYLLKQITSSLMYPESRLGKSFWNKGIRPTNPSRIPIKIV